MWSLMVNGGALMLPILICGVGAVLLFLERLFHLHRARIQQEDFLNGMYTVVNRGNTAEAVSICDQTPGPVAYMVRIALLHADEESEELKETITKAGVKEIPRLERNMGGLLTIAQITPLLGLLGTVVGLISVFVSLETKGPLVEICDLSSGMWRALATTAYGLCVSIPSFAGYNFLVSRVERITLDMEYVAEEIYRFILNGRTNGGAGKNGHV